MGATSDDGIGVGCGDGGRVAGEGEIGALAPSFGSSAPFFSTLV